VGALARLLALHLSRVKPDSLDEATGCVINPRLSIVKIVEDSDLHLGKLKQYPFCLDALATQARFLGHDEDLKRRLGLERVHETEKSGALRKLRAADAFIDVDGVVVDRPAFLRGVRLGMLDLASDGLILVPDTVLFGGLAGVDGGDHGILRLTACGPLSPSTSVHFTRRIGHGQPIPTL
jgi:hypothetical protein